MTRSLQNPSSRSVLYSNPLPTPGYPNYLNFDPFADEERVKLKAKWTLVTLVPGQALYLPKSWWHNVFSPPGSVALSVVVAKDISLDLETGRQRVEVAGHAAADRELIEESKETSYYTFTGSRPAPPSALSQLRPDAVFAGTREAEGRDDWTKAEDELILSMVGDRFGDKYIRDRAGPGFFAGQIESNNWPKEFRRVSAGGMRDRHFFLSDRGDPCSACHEPGDSSDILCDECDSGFHLGCVGLSVAPPGSWSCNKCEALNEEREAKAEEGRVQRELEKQEREHAHARRMAQVKKELCPDCAMKVQRQRRKKLVLTMGWNNCCVECKVSGARAHV